MCVCSKFNIMTNTLLLQRFSLQTLLDRNLFYLFSGESGRFKEGLQALKGIQIHIYTINSYEGVL